MIFPSHHLLRDRQAIRKKKQKFNNDIAESVSLLIKKKKKKSNCIKSVINQRSNLDVKNIRS